MAAVFPERLSTAMRDGDNMLASLNGAAIAQNCRTSRTNAAAQVSRLADSGAGEGESSNGRGLRHIDAAGRPDRTWCYFSCHEHAGTACTSCKPNKRKKKARKKVGYWKRLFELVMGIFCIEMVHEAETGV